MSDPKQIDTMRSLNFFDGVPEEELNYLASIAKTVQYSTNTLIFQEGERANKFFVIVEGSVGLEIAIEGRGKRILSVGSGELLGWSALFGSHAMKATARTLNPTKLLSFDAAQAWGLVERTPSLAAILLRQVARALDERLHATRLQMLQLCHHQFPDAVPLGSHEGAD